MADPLQADLLRQVSRSFYFSLAILPRDLRAPLGLGYLLARAADTVADTDLIARPERLAHLVTLRAAFTGAPADLAAVVAACAPRQTLAAERRLLEHVPAILEQVEGLPKRDRDEIRTVVATLTEGMVFDLERFVGADTATLVALDTMEELDRYLYLVAGCVGETWTALHVAHRPRLAAWDVAAMSARGVRFGKALQITNVLRDVPSDLAHGRCYLPARQLAQLGLAPQDLLEPAGRARARPLLERLLELALAHYAVAWSYTLAVPRREWRMRLACAWPLAIGLATLAHVAAHPDPLGAPTPIKIPRSRTRSLLARTSLCALSNRALAAEAARLTCPLARDGTRRAP